MARRQFAASTYGLLHRHHRLGISHYASMLVGWCSVAEIVSCGQGAIRRCTGRRRDCADDEPADVVGGIPRCRGRMVSDVAVEAVGWAGRSIPNVYYCRRRVLGYGPTRTSSREGGRVQMRRFGKWFLIALGSLVVLFAIAVTLTIGWRPFLGPKTRALTNRTFERTPQRLERGRYIATGLSGCVYCHSPHDWTAPGTPIVAGKESSGEVLPYAGLPGRIVASNLTPDQETGAGNWTDDQLARAIREGVGRDDRALFPIMPYQHYRAMSDEDLASVVVYLRSLPAVHNQLPATEIIFPVKYLIRSAPEPIAAPVAEDRKSTRL